MHEARQAKERRAAGQAWHDNDLVFCDKNGDAYTSDQLTWRFGKMTRRTGIGRWHAREGRHTAVLAFRRLSDLRAWRSWICPCSWTGYLDTSKPTSAISTQPSSSEVRICIRIFLDVRVSFPRYPSAHIYPVWRINLDKGFISTRLALAEGRSARRRMTPAHPAQA